MAAAALGIAGQVAFGPIGAIVGTVVGSLVDQLFLFPLLFSEDTTIPGVGSIDVNYADEGTPGAFAYGSRNRIAAQVILASAPFSKSGSTGGGKRGEVTTITWLSDIVYAITFNPLQGIERVDFDSQIAYQASPNYVVSYTINFIDSHFFSVDSVVIWEDVSGGAGTLWTLRAWEASWENKKTGGINGGPQDAPGLALFAPGRDVVVTWSTAGNPPLIVGPGHSPWVGTESLKVVESRITGVSQLNGVANTRLSIDMMPWVRQLPVTSIGGGQTWGGVSGGFYQTGRYLNAPGSGPFGTAPPQIGGTEVPFQPIVPGPSPPASWTFSQQGNPFVVPQFSEDINTYPAGGPTQQNELYIQRKGGASRTPALPSISTIGVHKGNISSRGNRVPVATCFANEAYTRDSAGIPQGPERQMIYMLQRVLFDHAQLTSVLVDLSKIVTNEVVLGLNFTGDGEAARPLSQLLMYGDLKVADYAGALHFIERAQREVFPVPHEALDGRPFGSPLGRKIKLRNAEQIEKPRRVHLKFINADADLQDGDVIAVRDTVSGLGPAGQAASDDAVRQFKIDVAMTRATARQKASRLIRDAHEMQRAGSVRMPFYSPRGDRRRRHNQALQITETDVMRLDTNASMTGTLHQGQPFYLLVQRVDIGADLLCEYEILAMPDDPTSVPVSTLDPTEPENPENQIHQIEMAAQPAFALEVLDMGPLLDRHAREPGVYLAYARRGDGSSPNGTLVQGVGNGTTFEQLEPATAPSTIAVLIRGVRRHHVVGVIDWTNALDVETLAGDHDAPFATVTEAELYSGRNMLAWSTPSGRWEVLQYLRATDLSNPDGDGQSTSRRWRLEGLRRGLRGTDQLCALHERGDRIVALDPARLHFHPVDMATAGRRRTFAVLPAFRAWGLDPVTGVDLALRSSLPLAPANARAERQSNGDVVISGVRRARGTYRMLGTEPAPLVETTESYDFVLGSRTINGATLPLTYTAAMQASDGTTDAEWTGALYQRDAVRGRGDAAFVRPGAVASGWQDEDSTDTLTDEAGNRILLV